jgi:general secretion pathway protein I
MKSQQGFSLIEVLIALAILAIALTAALTLTTRSTEYLIHVKDRILAQWVLDNTLAKVQMGIIHLQDDRPYKGMEQELSQNFYYETFISKQYAHANAIHIQAGLNPSKPLVKSEGFTWHNLGDDSE